MTLWPGAISQVGYPGAGDLDDCWVIATIWAATASDPSLRKPTVTEFRRHAGDPDDGFMDGGSLDEVFKGSRGVWPDQPVIKYSGDWAGFKQYVQEGRTASLAVNSARLPARMRYGFNGPHQVGIAWDDGFVLMNPLARNGTPPQPITEAELRPAATALYANGQVRAAIYPAPEDDVLPIYSVPGRVTARLRMDQPLREVPGGKEVAKVRDPKHWYDLVGQDEPGDSPVWYLIDHEGRNPLVWVAALAITERQTIGAPRSYPVVVTVGGKKVAGNVTLP